MSYILLVDDHAMFREPIRRVLEEAGHHVTAVESGAAAMASLAQLTPELIVLDLKMPGLSGEELLARIRRQEVLQRTPVIILTTETGKQSVLRLARLGVSAYLSKTNLSLERMLTLVRAALHAPEPTAVHGTPEPPAIGDDGRGAVDPASDAVASPSSNATAVRPVEAQSREPTHALRSIQPVARADEVLEALAASAELNGLSPMVSEVLRMTSDPSCTADEVAGVVEGDPAMALRVLRLANSCVNTRGGRVDSVRRAIVHIGITGIRNAALSLGIVERFTAPAFQSHINTLLFWEHSIACGVIAAEIARATDPTEADTAFASGLLHDVGRLILAEQLGPRYIQVIDTARRLQLPLDQVEVRMLSVSHADIMEAILRNWKLPRELTTPIVLHHASLGGGRTVGRRQPPDVMRLILANRLAHALMLGSSGNDTVSSTVEACQLLGLDVGVLKRIEAHARRKTDEMKVAMLSRSDEASWPDAKDHYRAQLGGRFRPLFVGGEPAFNAYRMLCSELAVGSGEWPPTVGVVHVSDAGSQGSLGGLLMAAEQAAGTQSLPLVILSPSGEPCLGQRVLGGRACRCLRPPFTVPRFVAAANELICENGKERNQDSSAQACR